MATCPITKYTSTDDIRNCLGVTDNELTDDMVTGQNLDLDLLLDLDSWLPTHETLWQAKFQNGATAEDTRYANLVQMYSQWYCAVRLAEMQLAIPQRISDGKADMRRFSELDLDQVLKYARARMMKFRQMLEEDVLGNTRSGFSLTNLASPSYDPVTGTET